MELMLSARDLETLFCDCAITLGLERNDDAFSKH